MGSLLYGGCDYLACSAFLVWIGSTAALIVLGGLLFLLDEHLFRARRDVSKFRQFADSVAREDFGSAEDVVAETLSRFDRDSHHERERRWSRAGPA